MSMRLSLPVSGGLPTGAKQTVPAFQGHPAPGRRGPSVLVRVLRPILLPSISPVITSTAMRAASGSLEFE